MVLSHSAVDSADALAPSVACTGRMWPKDRYGDDRVDLAPYLLASGRRAFCDFGVDDRFVGEFDGLIKYRRKMRAGPVSPNVSIAVARAVAERRRPPHR